MDKEYLQSLPKDVLLMMLLDLDLSDIVSLCQTSSRIDKDVCKNSNFWGNKIRKDFPDAKYTSLNTRQIYLKLDKIKKEYPELKSILSLIIVDNFKFAGFIDNKVLNLLNSLDEKVRIKIMNDYNKHESYGRVEQISQPTGEAIIDLISKAGLYYNEEYEAFYDSLIEQLEQYIKNPNITFDPSKWERYN